MPYILGETKEEINAETLEENKSAAIEMIRQARYSIDIFTQDLDKEIYNNEEIETSIFKLSKRHPNTRIRILVQDSKKAAQHGHCLIRLAQSLTSSVFIHKPSLEYKDEQCAFMVVDKVGLMHRITAENRNYNTSIDFMAPRRASKLSDFFTEVWEHSTRDVQIRRLHI